MKISHSYDVVRLSMKIAIIQLLTSEVYCRITTFTPRIFDWSVLEKEKTPLMLMDVLHHFESLDVLDHFYWKIRP